MPLDFAIVVSGLSKAVTLTDIQASFTPFGHPLHISLKVSSTGQSLGISQIHYSNHSAASAAIDYYHNKIVDGMVLSVTHLAKPTRPVVSTMKTEELVFEAPARTFIARPPKPTFISKMVSDTIPVRSAYGAHPHKESGMSSGLANRLGFSNRGDEEIGEVGRNTSNGGGVVRGESWRDRIEKASDQSQRQARPYARPDVVHEKRNVAQRLGTEKRDVSSRLGKSTDISSRLGKRDISSRLGPK